MQHPANYSQYDGNPAYEPIHLHFVPSLSGDTNRIFIFVLTPLLPGQAGLACSPYLL